MVTARDRRAKGYVDPSSRREEPEVLAPYAATACALKPPPSEPEPSSVPGPENRSIPLASRYAIYVLNQGNQPKIVGFDIENHTTALQDARLRVGFLHLVRRLPGCCFCDRQL